MCLLISQCVCVAVCVAGCCRVLQCVFQGDVGWYSVLQCVTVCCSVLWTASVRMAVVVALQGALQVLQFLLHCVADSFCSYGWFVCVDVLHCVL